MARLHKLFQGTLWCSVTLWSGAPFIIDSVSPSHFAPSWPGWESGREVQEGPKPRLLHLLVSARGRCLPLPEPTAGWPAVTLRPPQRRLRAPGPSDRAERPPAQPIARPVVAPGASLPGCQTCARWAVVGGAAPRRTWGLGAKMAVPGHQDGGTRARKWRYLGTKMALCRKFSKTLRYSASSFSACFSASVLGQAQHGPFSPPHTSVLGFSVTSSTSMVPSAYFLMGILSARKRVAPCEPSYTGCREWRARTPGLRPAAAAHSPQTPPRPPPHLWSSSCAGTGSCPGAGAASARCSSSGCRWAGRAGSTSRSAEKRSLRPRGHPGGWKELGGDRGRVRKRKEAESQAARHSAQTHQSVTGTGHAGEHRHKTPTEPPFPTVLLSLYSICSQGISAVTNMTEQSTAKGGGAQPGLGGPT